MSDYPNVSFDFSKSSLPESDFMKYVDMAGLPRDFEGNISVSDTWITWRDKGVRVKVEAKGFDMVRIFDKDSVENAYFVMGKDSKYLGRGLELFSNQVRRMNQGGFTSIKTEAAGSKKEKYNGYYTWVRFGYIPNKNTTHSTLKAINEKLKNKGLSTFNSITELMQTTTGRKLWRDNGTAWTGTFDTRPGSESWNTLASYYKERTGQEFNP